MGPIRRTQEYTSTTHGFNLPVTSVQLDGLLAGTVTKRQVPSRVRMCCVGYSLQDVDPDPFGGVVLPRGSTLWASIGISKERENAQGHCLVCKTNTQRQRRKTAEMLRALQRVSGRTVQSHVVEATKKQHSSQTKKQNVQRY